MNHPMIAMTSWTTAFCLIATCLSWFLDRGNDVLHCSAAALVCLLPNLLVLRWVSAEGTSRRWFLAFGIGTVTRLFGTLGLALLAYFLFPQLQQERWWLWVIGFYLLTLVMEIFFLLRLPTLPAPRQNSYKSSEP